MLRWFVCCSFYKDFIWVRRDDTGVRMEIVELPATAHPFYFGTQYHPEVRSASPRAVCVYVCVCGG